MTTLKPTSARQAVAVLGWAVATGWLLWVYSSLMMVPAVGIFHDDGIYLVTARALAEGRGYIIESLPWPAPQTKYPILFPWLLSLVWKYGPPFPENLLFLRAVPLLSAVGWAVAVVLLLRRLGAPRTVAAAIVLLTAVSPWVVFLATTLLSETLFAFLLTAGILAIVRVHQQEGPGNRDGIVAGLLMGGAFLTRTAGAVPALVGCLFLAWRRRWTACAYYAATFLACAAPWMLWVRKQPVDVSIDNFYSSAPYAAWNVILNFAWVDKLSVLAVNSAYMMAAGLYWGLSTPIEVAIIVAILTTGLVVRGLWQSRKTAVPLLVVAYLGMVLVWAWPPTRFIVPLLPLMIWLAYRGGERWPPLTAAVAALLVVCGAINQWQLVAAVREKGGAWFRASGVDDWHRMSDQIDWINANAPSDAIVVAVHDPTYYLMTGRKSIRPFNFDPLLLNYNLRRQPGNGFGGTDDFLKRLLHVEADYVVVTPRDGVESLTTDLLEKKPGGLTLVTGDPKDFAIYRVNRALLSGAGFE
jgi:hypothetical protein